MDDQKLNIAASYVGTQALGPGVRSIVWVQGCPFHCSGCISPQWIPRIPARQVQITNLVRELLADPAITGFTFSGGEPFLQARGLTQLIREARLLRELNLICYTGYTLEYLMQKSQTSDIRILLSEIDVLIDGPYIKHLDDNRGLRGSSNQRIHHLTASLSDFDFETQPRSAEIYIKDGEILFVGVPPRGVYPHVIEHTEAQLNRWRCV